MWRATFNNLEGISLIKHIADMYESFIRTKDYFCGITLNREQTKKYIEECKRIEKSLKALEIIKEKVMPLICISDGFVYDGELFHRIEISEEDSILLKEVLSNERN